MLIRKVDLRYGQWILIYGASSGVGSAAIQIAKTVGARIITTAGSDEKFSLADKMGADFVIDYKNHSISTTVKDITFGRGVDVVFEHTGRKPGWIPCVRSAGVENWSHAAQQQGRLQKLTSVPFLSNSSS